MLDFSVLVNILRKSVTQEHPSGCGVACVAYAVDIHYAEALALFDQPEKACNKGYYCREIEQALSKFGQESTYFYIKSNNRRNIYTTNTIVFIKRNKKYPIGHYLVRTEDSYWMNPWINYPMIAPAMSGFQKKLPGTVVYAIQIS